MLNCGGVRAAYILMFHLTSAGVNRRVNPRACGPLCLCPRSYYIHTYIYIYICVCVCVCVCARARARLRAYVVRVCVSVCVYSHGPRLPANTAPPHANTAAPPSNTATPLANTAPPSADLFWVNPGYAPFSEVAKTSSQATGPASQATGNVLLSGNRTCSLSSNGRTPSSCARGTHVGVTP